ncbi:MAG: ferrochelatase [Pontiella sp.]|nr:ferrochelatase [Pontiella sp.]
MKRGFILMNTGSPASTQTTDVRRYLNEFLMDPYVIDLPWPLRALLVKGFILPKRPAESAEAYKTIWTEHGSPLIHTCKQIRNALRERIDAPIEIGMAYGTPSFKTAIGKMLDAGVDDFCLLPMFPQYAMATVGSCVAGVMKEIRQRKSTATVRTVEPFYADPNYIEPLAQSLTEVDEHILFSYHGLPERHLKKTDPTGHHCLSTPECCNEPSIAHDTCYRYQCLATTRAIVKAANIASGRYRVAFQSRLGRDKWLEPATDKMLEELPAKGIKKLAVICPAFFCDCLETLEEIEIRGRETFLDAGGESFRMIPCINDTEAGIKCLENLIANADHWPSET